MILAKEDRRADRPYEIIQEHRLADSPQIAEQLAVPDKPGSLEPVKAAKELLRSREGGDPDVRRAALPEAPADDIRKLQAVGEVGLNGTLLQRPQIIERTAVRHEVRRTRGS